MTAYYGGFVCVNGRGKLVKLGDFDTAEAAAKAVQDDYAEKTKTGELKFPDGETGKLVPIQYPYPLLIRTQYGDERPFAVCPDRKCSNTAASNHHYTTY